MGGAFNRAGFYRRGAGILLFDRRAKVWTGKRALAAMPQGVALNWRWQLPQGGLDAGETPEQAARRELLEETGQANAVLLGQSRDWLSYEFPKELLAQGFLDGALGQRQKWFAMGFLGRDGDFDVAAHTPVEFDSWRWQELENLPARVVPFKRRLYEALVAEFLPLRDKIRRKEILFDALPNPQAAPKR